MSSLMHTADDNQIRLYDAGKIDYPRALCGVLITEGAPRKAPMCPTCMRKAGWTEDRRR